MVVRDGKCADDLKRPLVHAEHFRNGSTWRAVGDTPTVGLVGLRHQVQLPAMDRRWSIQSNFFPKTARKYQ